MTWLKRVTSILRPWPSRADRKEALRGAAERKAAAAKRTGHARQAAQSIEHLVYGDNHIAAAVAESIRRSREGR